MHHVALLAVAKAKRVYLTWTDEMDATLLAVLVEHHNNGDHSQNGWKPHVYSAAIKNVRDKCNMDIRKGNISSRCKLLTSTMRSLVRYCHRVVLAGIEKIISYQLIVRMSGLDMW